MSVFKLWIFSGSFFASDQSLPSPYTVLETLKQFTLNICCTAGVSARSKSPQEGAWVDFKHEAAGQRQEHGATEAQEKHLYRTAGHTSPPCWLLNTAGAKSCCLMGRGRYYWFGKGWSGQAAVYHSSLVFPALLLTFQKQQLILQWAHTLCSVSTDWLSPLSNRGTRRAETRLSHPSVTQFLASMTYTWATTGLRDINVNGAAELELLPSRQNLVFWSALFALWQPVNILRLAYYYYSQFSLLL